MKKVTVKAGGRNQGKTQAMAEEVVKMTPEIQKVEITTHLAQDDPLVSYIKRGDNLQRLQMICGSLGKNAEHVFLGRHNLKDIGEVIGASKPEALSNRSVLG